MNQLSLINGKKDTKILIYITVVFDNILFVDNTKFNHFTKPAFELIKQNSQFLALLIPENIPEYSKKRFPEIYKILIKQASAYMNQFFTTLKPNPQEASISYNSKIVLLGSCFVENIGEKLHYYKFRTTTNPFGIIFHPEAIHSLIKRIVDQNKFTVGDIFFHNEQWHCFEVHSQLSNIDKNEFLETLNSLLKNTFEQLKNASHIILTYGTAWCYEHLLHKKIVANCHKVPQKEFKKKLSAITSLEHTIQKTLSIIETLNTNAQVIYTVSPVRHLKDGIVENNRSKSNLIASLHNTIEKNKNASYFPSYELVMDCLREYRFYKSDLIHPNQITIDFIWEHFKSDWLHNTDTQTTLKQVTEIQQGLAHRPFNKNSTVHQKFLESIKNKKEVLKKKCPFIEF